VIRQQPLPASFCVCGFALCEIPSPALTSLFDDERRHVPAGSSTQADALCNPQIPFIQAHQTSERRKMKALVEIALIWGIILALILAAFLLNLWLVHLIELLVGAKGTWGIIVAAAVMATGWIFSFGSKKESK
jgi:hypothetical protein